MTAAFFIGIENACANDWYESMESSTLDYASYQNAAKSVDPVGVASQDKAVSGVFSQAILSRDAINSELQKEIALQAANQIQVIRPNAGGGESYPRFEGHPDKGNR